MFSRVTFYALLSSAAVNSVAGQGLPEPAVTSTCSEPIPFCPNLPADQCTFGEPDSLFDIGDMAEAGSNYLSPVEEGGFGSELWFSLTVKSPCQLTLAFDTCSGAFGFDADLQIFSGPCDNLVEIGQDDDSCTGIGEDDAQLETILSEGSNDNPTTYYIRLSAKDPTTSTGFFSIQGGVQGECSTGGDPHFKRWNHAERDTFHGECDMVLLHSDSFQDNAGLDVHVRTTMKDFYSYIEAAAVRIGETVVEFLPESFFLAGVEYKYDAVPDFKFQDGEHEYAIKTAVIDHKRETHVMLNAVSYIKIRSTKNFMYVSMVGGPQQFGDSVGIMGEFGTGNMVGRNGEFDGDFVDFGFEWQVNPATDRVLFKDAREPQLPYEKCRMPTQTASAGRRKLRAANRVLLEQASDACAAAGSAGEFDLCVDDVMATGDINMASMFLEM